MKPKNLLGHINSSASMTQPRMKKKRVVRVSVPITGPRRRRLTKSKLAKSSALPNTAGITVVKLRVVQKAYSSAVNISAPTYVQFCVRRLNSSKNHQTGAETINNPTYLRGLRVIRDVPVRQKTRPSIVRQYPSHNGKKPQWVRGPVNIQLITQKMRIKPIPSHPCKGSLLFSLIILFVLILVVILQVYTEISRISSVVE